MKLRHAQDDPLIAEYLRHCKVEKGLAATTIEQYRDVLTKFAASVGRSRVLGVGREGVRRYIANYAETAIPRSQAKLWSQLHQFFKFLMVEGLRSDNPMLLIDRPKFGKRILMPLSPVEARILMESGKGKTPLDIRDRAILETFYGSGIRVSELTSARLRDLRLEVGTLLVHGKGDKERIVPVGRPEVRALSAYLETARPKLANSKSPDTIFLGKRGEQLTRQSVFHILRRRCRAAGVPPVGPHTLRRSLGAHMIENHADLRSIQTILGHADISTTELYTHVAIEHLRRQLLKHHPRSHPRNQIPLFQSPTPLPMPKRHRDRKRRA